MIGAIGLLAWLAGAVGGPAEAIDPLTQPITTSRSAEWLAPAAPERIFAGSYLVGFAGMSVALIDTGAGLVLVDGALPQAAPTILANVRALGFDPKDIQFILSTEPHFDHAGGLAALARDTGATVVASVRGAEGLRTGRHAPDDPQRAYGGSWPAVAHVRTMKDGEELKLGHSKITAVATPGHTMGSMSWRWRACEERRCKTIVFAASLNPVAADGYHFTSQAGAPFVQGFAESYRKMDATACDILISAHPDNAGLGRYNDRPGACRAYADRSRKALAMRMAAERAGSAR